MRSPVNPYLQRIVKQRQRCIGRNAFDKAGKGIAGEGCVQGDHPVIDRGVDQVTE